MAKETHQFETNVPELIKRLGVNLYNDPFICIRELVQNASDACLIAEGDLGAERGRIDIDIDQDESTISITDTGIGMSAEDLRVQLSTIATSHKAEIRSKLAKSFEGYSGIAGRFGIGFLSVFIVSDDVTVMTRHHDDRKNENRNGTIWRSTGDGSYTIQPSHRPLPKGTTVRVKVRRDASDLLHVSALIDTLKRHCPFIRTPYFVNRSALSINHDAPPWYPQAPVDAGRSYILEQFKGQPIIEFPVAFEGHWQLSERDSGFSRRPWGRRSLAGEPAPFIRLNGYFAIPDSNVQFMSDRCRVYTAGLYVGSMHNSLPPWANFVVGGVECPDLELTLGRDNVMDSPTWWAVQQVLTAKLTEALVRSLRDPRAKTRRAWSVVFQHHREQILRAVIDERRGRYGMAGDKNGSPFFSAMRDLIPFHMGPDWLTIDEMVERGLSMDIDSKTTIFYRSVGSRAHEGAGIQEGLLFEEAGRHFINASNYYEREILDEINKDRADIELVPVEKAVPYLVSKPSDAARGKPLIEIFQSLGVTAEMTRFEPASLSAVISLDGEDGFRPDRVDLQDPGALQRLLIKLTSARGQVSVRPYVLLVNEDNPLVQQVLDQLHRRGGDVLLAQIARQIYHSAILVFGDRDVTAISEIVPSMSSVMTSFFGYLEESERELQRVRRLAEVDRGLRLDAEHKLADLQPEGIDPRSVFLSYSFDKSSEQLARQFRNLLTDNGMKVRDGHVESMGSLSGHILKGIKESAVFVGILTPRADGAGVPDGVSGWVMEEKGAAVALGKDVLLLGHESIAEDAFRRLSGDPLWISSDGSDQGWSLAFDKALAAMRRTMEHRADASDD